MRFTHNGPLIPNELLNARDEGRVVFFCGAGVSKARAKLPDYFGLAEDVIRELGVSEDSTVSKALARAREIDDEVDVAGVISVDRVFSLLEREFEPADIQAAVARALAPKAEPDLSAHQLLLRLATTPDSKTQLVTTNFDRLFEKCGRDLAIYQPSRLRNPSRFDELNGLVYLHGRVNDRSTGADGDGFVLSSSEFGYAYLSEGWATGIFRDIIRTYVVVFIGYSADDPPIRYLLEGLNRSPDPSRRIYAFQAEESDETLARWHDKGVEPISYAHSDEHSALWETLEPWAERADDPIAWRRTIVNLAMGGPESLQPHQRGQVAHVVSTYEGTREFAERTPPAEWLCAFDPSCRYAKSDQSDWQEPERPVIDPFALYCLDSDAAPQTGDPHRRSATRDIPADAWDAFAVNSLDRVGLSDEHFAALRGRYSAHIPRLSRRIECLGTWIAMVAKQPAAVWWAARQQPLHPGIRRGTPWWLDRGHEPCHPTIRVAWRYLLEAWKRIDDSSREWNVLKRLIDRDGWDSAAVRDFTAITCPYVKASPALMSRPTPPKKDADLRLSDLVGLEVECPVPPLDAEIPNQWLEHVLRGLRKNIELAVRLCEEVGDMDRFHIAPIARDNTPGISDHARAHGLSACVIQFGSLFERLIDLDVSKAKREFLAWPADDDTAFSRLRLWAGGNPTLATPHEFYEIVKGLSDDAFWSYDHQRDFLLVLAKRWGTLAVRSRKEIERRLLKGPPKWKGADEVTYQEHRAWATLERLQWLANSACKFSFDVRAEIAKRRPSARTWKPEYANHAAESREMRSGWVATNTEHSVLLREPIASILSKARELSGRAGGNTFEEREPFAGLCAERPVRAYRALAHAARQNDFPEWAWAKFLMSSAREHDRPLLSTAIALRLCRLPDASLRQVLDKAASWLQKSGKALSRERADAFDTVVARLVEAVELEPSEPFCGQMDGGRGRDWATEAINSSVGHIAMAILEDSRLEYVVGDVDSDGKWLTHLATFLNLPGDPRRHAIAIISHYLGWFHRLVPEWTERHLLSIIDSDDVSDQAALWAGFFWNPAVTSPGFYSRLKPALLKLAKERDSSREGHVEALASLVLSGWTTRAKDNEKRLVSGDELREVLLRGGDDFRSHVLWRFRWMLDGDEPKSFEESVARAQELFRDVWPRQRSVKNPTMSMRLVELLVSNVEGFPRLAESALPLLTKIDQAHGHYFADTVKVNAIIGKHSDLFLTILHAVLPDEAANWPYGIGDVLEKIGDAKGNLLADRRLQELKRKWSAR